MPLDPRLEPLRAALLAAPPVDPSLSAAERRAMIVAARAAAPRGVTTSDGPQVASVTDMDAEGVPVRVYRPTADPVLPGLVMIHGGGWWLGDLDDWDGGARKRCVAGKCVAVSIDYRLAPEHPFPAALDDCCTAVRWVFAHAAELGIDPARIAIDGGSAGGNLAAAVTLRLRDEGGPRLVAQVLEVPGTDLTLGSPSIDFIGPGYLLDRTALEECVGFYCGPDGDPKNPYISPLFGDLEGLPPALVTTCEMDPIRDDGELYASKLAAAGVSVTARRFLGMAHGSMEMDVLMPDVAAEYMGELARFLRGVFEPLQ